MHGFIRTKHGGGQYLRHKRHHAAAVRAFAGARLLLGLSVKPKTQREAANLVASTPRYIVAAITVIQAEDLDLIERVQSGSVPLLEAADSVHNRAGLIKAYRAGGAADRKALGTVFGVDNVFDDVILPAL